MSLTLDPATEQRIHREAQLRNLTEPGQLLNRAFVLPDPDCLIEEESCTK